MNAIGERCRAQKLRCVPFPDNPVGPCHRCASAKVSHLCVFHQRVRTRRSRHNRSSVENHSDQGSVRSVPSLPGTSVFSITPTPFTTENALASHSREPLDTGDDENDMGFDPLSVDALLHDSAVINFENDVALEEYQSKKPSIAANLGMYVDDQLSPAGVLLNGVNNVDAESNLTAAPTQNRDRVVLLSSFISEIASYECRLSEQLGRELDKFPIGDALFFSYRFHDILWESSHCFVNPPFYNVASTLLILSGFMALTRIVAAVFDYFHRQLTDLFKKHQQQEARATGGIGPGWPYLSDARLYRGVRLDQLELIMTDVDWDVAVRVRKAASMLLNALGKAEKVLGLPADARVVHVDQGGVQNRGTPDLSGLSEECGPLVGEGIMTVLPNGIVYRSLRQQAGELRRKATDIDTLLRRLLDK